MSKVSFLTYCGVKLTMKSDTEGVRQCNPIVMWHVAETKTGAWFGQNLPLKLETQGLPSTRFRAASLSWSFLWVHHPNKENDQCL